MPDPLSPAPAAAREEAGVDAKPRLAPVQHLGREQRHGGHRPAPPRPAPRPRVAAPRSSGTLGARGRRAWRGAAPVPSPPLLVSALASLLELWGRGELTTAFACGPAAAALKYIRWRGLNQRRAPKKTGFQPGLVPFVRCCSGLDDLFLGNLPLCSLGDSSLLQHHPPAQPLWAPLRCSHPPPLG